MSKGTLRLTILGCGSSSGVPRIGRDWGACDPNDPRNYRRRCSLLVQRWTGPATGPDEATTVLVDVSPDFREQALRVGLTRLDAVLFSHDHADQTHGLDDLRGVAYLIRRRVPVMMDSETRRRLRTRFGYCFDGEGGYPPIVDDVANLTPYNEVRIDGPGGRIVALPLDQDHGGVRSLGFRFGPAAYSNDVVDLPEASLQRLSGLDLWIVDALRYAPHPTHAHLERTLGWIGQAAPKRAVLTNLHVDMDYAQLAARLPLSVEPAVDFWSTDLPIA